MTGPPLPEPLDEESADPPGPHWTDDDPTHWTDDEHWADPDGADDDEWERDDWAGQDPPGTWDAPR